MEPSFGGWKVMVTILDVPASTVDFSGSMVNALEWGFEGGRGSIMNSPVP